MGLFKCLRYKDFIIIMQQGRRYRSEQTFVRDWGTFLKVWKKFDLKKLEPMTIEQRAQQIKARYKELIQDPLFQCFVFPDSLKPEHLKLMIQIAQLKQFSPILEFEHEGFYLDKPKQLVIFKRRASVATYLAKYRPTDEFKKILAVLTEISKQYRTMLIKRNIKISQQSSQEQIDPLTKELNLYYQQKMQPRLVEWRKIVVRMLIDFKNQPKKQEFLFLGVNSYLTDEIKKLSKQQQLYISNRYDKISPSDEYRDILITKYDRSEASQSFDDKSLSDEQFLQQEKQKELTKQVKQIKLKEPRDIENVSYRSKESNGVVCSVSICSFGRVNPIDFIVVRLNSPKQTHQKYEQKIKVEPDQLEYQVTLPCLHSGCSVFELLTLNTVGFCKNPYIFKVWMDGIKGSEDSEGIMKLNQQNKPLYIMGQNQCGLIPNYEQQSSNIIRTTSQSWQKLQNQCYDFSVSSHATICNQRGEVASWGYMHFFDDEGLNHDEKNQDQQEELQNYLGKLSSQYFRVQKPSLIIDRQCIRKVSCGEGYCLMADSLGRAWSFGINSFGQLGIEHSNENENTQEPIVIKFFRFQKIFVTDVIASYFGASFAIDDKGLGYRWGTNQVDQSNRPIIDSYNNTINFEFPDIIAAQSLPVVIGKKLITQKIRQIHPGFHYVFALTQENNVYGWGRTKYLGNGQIQNAHFEKIQNICNPIPVLKNVVKLSIGKNHCLAQKSDGSLIGWGETKYYKSNSSQFAKKPEVIKQEFKGDFICGPDFTVYLEQNKLNVIGNEQIFKNKNYNLPCKILKIKAGEGVIMVMGEYQAQEKTENSEVVSKQKKEEEQN